MIIREAIASCAMEHREGCVCTICRANRGDQDAYAQVLAGVMLGGERVLQPRHSKDCAELTDRFGRWAGDKWCETQHLPKREAD